MTLLFRPKKYEATIESIRDESSKVKIFSIRIPEVFDFVPGMNVVLSLPHVLNEKGLPLKRVYSIASKPNQDMIELCIAIVPSPSFTSELAKLKPRSKITVEGPFGMFLLKEPVDKIMFISAGTGIAPFMSMTRYLISKGKSGITFMFGFRNIEDFLYRKELEAIASKHKDFKLITSSSKDKWQHQGRITEIIPKIVGKDEITTYVCGPKQMVEDTKSMLLSLGWSGEKVFCEHW